MSLVAWAPGSFIFDFLNDWLHNVQYVPGMDLLAFSSAVFISFTISFWLRIINVIGGEELVEHGF